MDQEQLNKQLEKLIQYCSKNDSEQCRSVLQFCKSSRNVNLMLLDRLSVMAGLKSPITRGDTNANANGNQYYNNCDCMLLLLMKEDDLISGRVEKLVNREINKNDDEASLQLPNFYYIDGENEPQPISDVKITSSSFENKNEYLFSLDLSNTKNNSLQDFNKCISHVKFTSMDNFYINGNDNKEMKITIENVSDSGSIQDSFVANIDDHITSIKAYIKKFIADSENNSQNYLFFIIKDSDNDGGYIYVLINLALNGDTYFIVNYAYNKINTINDKNTFTIYETKPDKNVWLNLGEYRTPRNNDEERSSREEDELNREEEQRRREEEERLRRDAEELRQEEERRKHEEEEQRRREEEERNIFEEEQRRQDEERKRREEEERKRREKPIPKDPEPSNNNIDYDLISEFIFALNTMTYESYKQLINNLKNSVKYSEVKQSFNTMNLKPNISQNANELYYTTTLKPVEFIFFIENKSYETHENKWHKVCEIKIFKLNDRSKFFRAKYDSYLKDFVYGLSEDDLGNPIYSIIKINELQQKKIKDESKDNNQYLEIIQNQDWIKENINNITSDNMNYVVFTNNKYNVYIKVSLVCSNNDKDKPTQYIVKMRYHVKSRDKQINNNEIDFTIVFYDTATKTFLNSTKEFDQDKCIQTIDEPARRDDPVPRDEPARRDTSSREEAIGDDEEKPENKPIPERVSKPKIEHIDPRTIERYTQNISKVIFNFNDFLSNYASVNTMLEDFRKYIDSHSPGL